MSKTSKQTIEKEINKLEKQLFKIEAKERVILEKNCKHLNTRYKTFITDNDNTYSIKICNVCNKQIF